MLETGIAPDFIVVDGSEGGTGAAPLEFTDSHGRAADRGAGVRPQRAGGHGLRDTIKIGCSGKIVTGFSIVSRLALGADYTNAARAMMFALGCIQAQRCHTNTCPVGVATQDPGRSRGLVVDDKAERVHQFHRNTIASVNTLIAAMGLDGPSGLRPALLHRRIDPNTVCTYDELYDYLDPGELLVDPPAAWLADWNRARPDRFSA